MMEKIELWTVSHELPPFMTGTGGQKANRIAKSAERRAAAFPSSGDAKPNVFGYVGYTKRSQGSIKRVYYACMCRCGEKLIKSCESLRNGRTKCARCAQGEHVELSVLVDGTSNRDHPLWSRWQAMRQRCNNPNRPQYPRYGARGIRVCARWDCPVSGFSNFVSDMGTPPNMSDELDRIDNDGHYEPSNCRWLGLKEHRRKHAYG